MQMICSSSSPLFGCTKSLLCSVATLYLTKRLQKFYLIGFFFTSVIDVSASVCLIDVIIIRPDDTLFDEKFMFLSLQAALPISISFLYFRESLNNHYFWKGNYVILSFSVRGLKCVPKNNRQDSACDN